MPLTAERHARTSAPHRIPHSQLGQPDNAETLRLVSAALAENRLHCAYQPIVTTVRPGVVAFYECLARIVDRNGDVIPAGRFMPAVEGEEIGRLVDRAILREAITVLETQHRVRLSVNLSANGLCDKAWLAILKDANARTPGICDFLIIEITESAFMELSPEVLAFLEDVRRLGCSIAIDDFGAGHTSIAHLSKFRFDFLKIDGSFVTGLSQNTDNQFLIKSMVSIARHFEMVCVAEMVDSDRDIEILRSFGVDCLQGFHLGMPDMTIPGTPKALAAHG